MVLLYEVPSGERALFLSFPNQPLLQTRQLPWGLALLPGVSATQVHWAETTQ